MRIGINKLHWPVTTLGPGRRIGIWLQGCGIHCPGCVSRDTWAQREDAFIDTARVLDWCHQGAETPDGVTISGGEPFEQPEALADLLAGLAAWRNELGAEFDLLCYSGMSYRRLRRDFAPILAQLDALIPEPFVDRLADAGPWRGSANQRLVMLSPLGRARYASAAEDPAAVSSALQISVDAGRIWFIGIPRRGDMDRLDDAVRARGIIAEGPSWRA
jgi:anaerobic ribonucleoside-triphosphate reductase activating protein